MIMDRKNREAYICDCDEPDHLVVIGWEDDAFPSWDVMHIYVAVSTEGFWRRFWTGFLYTFRSIPFISSSTWVCLNDEDALRMKEQIEKFLVRHNNKEQHHDKKKDSV